MSAREKIDPHDMVEAIDNAQYDNDLDVTITTNKGDINLTLFATKTPKTVANFVGLAEKGYYDNLLFHRVINDFMIQNFSFKNKNVI